MIQQSLTALHGVLSRAKAGQVHHHSWQNCGQQMALRLKGTGRGTWEPGPVAPGGNRVCWRSCFESALFETTAFPGPILASICLPTHTVRLSLLPGRIA
jgi:hypothetical protein